MRALAADADGAGAVTMGAPLPSTSAEGAAAEGAAEPSCVVDASATGVEAVRGCLLDRNQPTSAAMIKHPPIAAKPFVLRRTARVGVGGSTLTVGASGVAPVTGGGGGTESRRSMTSPSLSGNGGDPGRGRSSDGGRSVATLDRNVGVGAVPFTFTTALVGAGVTLVLNPGTPVDGPPASEASLRPPFSNDLGPTNALRSAHPVGVYG